MNPMKLMLAACAAICAAVCALTPAGADEGMWTYDNFPTAKVQATYGFAPGKEWLEHVRLSSVRLAGGCSGSIVSPDGLVMTNHHCARSCISENSTKEKDLMAGGFYAADAAQEIKCPDMEINQLLEIKDVTERVDAATRGASEQKYADVQKAELSRIEKECATGDDTRCDVVPLYHGGRHHLYKFRRFQDVRLVFAPEGDIAHFGGDPDNFMFPRYCLDASFLRIYKDGRPARTEHHFDWSPSGAAEGDLTFVPGNPGSTSRLFTVAELEYERDVALPRRLLRLAEERGMLTEFGNRGAEQKRISNTALLRTENSYKGIRGRHEALLDKKFFATKVASETALRARVEADPRMRAAYGGAWDSIARAKDEQRLLQRRHSLLEGISGSGFAGALMGHAKTLVRAATELPLPNEKRLREYADSKLPALRQRLFSAAPIYDEFEIQNLTFSLTKLREELGPDDPLVRKALGKSSPRDFATALVGGTQLKDIAVRKQLLEGGRAAVESSQDSMIRLALLVEPEARAIRKRMEESIESVLKKNDELIARAQFELLGTSTYPDATFTPRVSYGRVKGFQTDGRAVSPITLIRGLFDRETGNDPFELPVTWTRARAELDLSTPMNFATDNDIIGGNSGSPVIDKQARIVGLVFDGNIYSLGGDYGFDATVNRAVAVHSSGLIEALEKVYGARRLLHELLPSGSAGGGQ